MLFVQNKEQCTHYPQAYATNILKNIERNQKHIIGDHFCHIYELCYSSDKNFPIDIKINNPSGT